MSSVALKNCRNRMKSKLLIVSLTLPMLIIGVGQNLASLKVVKQGNFQYSRPPAKLSQATLDKPTTAPVYLAARDEQKKECKWVGICDKWWGISIFCKELFDRTARHRKVLHRKVRRDRATRVELFNSRSVRGEQWAGCVSSKAGRQSRS